MSKSKIVLIMAIISFILISSIKNYSQESITTDIPVSIDYYKNTNEELEEDIVEDEVINIVLGDWLDYRDNQYTPELPKDTNIDNRVEDYTTDTNLVAKVNKVVLNIENRNPNLHRALSMLNPYMSSERQVYVMGWNIAYGVTQINVKLIPLATLNYPDFETNIESQLKFLNDYLNIKSKKGMTLEEIVNQYKLCAF